MFFLVVLYRSDNAKLVLFFYSTKLFFFFLPELHKIGYFAAVPDVSIHLYMWCNCASNTGFFRGSGPGPGLLFVPGCIISGGFSYQIDITKIYAKCLDMSI